MIVGTDSLKGRCVIAEGNAGGGRARRPNCARSPFFYETIRSFSQRPMRLSAALDFRHKKLFNRTHQPVSCRLDIGCRTWPVRLIYGSSLVQAEQHLADTLSFRSPILEPRRALMSRAG